MLLSRFFDGERGHSGEPAGFVNIKPGRTQMAGMMQFQEIGAHGGEQTDRFLAGPDQGVEVSRASGP